MLEYANGNLVRYPGIDGTLKRNGFDMKKTMLLLLLGIFLVLPVQYAPAAATDLGVTSPRTTVRTYIKREHRRYVGCPAYSCYALYGAYGPYGGTAYWARYTGWYR